MTSNSNAFILVFTLLLCTSCTDFIEVDVPVDELELAAYGFLNNQENVAVTVYRTAGINEQVAVSDLQVDDALVMLIHEGNRDTLGYDSEGRYLWDRAANNGGVYQLEIEKEGFPTLYAETTVPDAPHFDAVSEYIGMSSRYETLRDFYVKLSLHDEPGIHYYQLGLYFRRIESRQGVDWATHYFWCNEILFRNNPADVGSQSVESPPATCDIVYFADETFDGQTKDFTLELEQEIFGLPNTRDLIVTSMGEHYFKYHQSLALQRRNTGDPFAEPVGLHSNIINGQGVFGSYSTRIVTLNFSSSE